MSFILAKEKAVFVPGETLHRSNSVKHSSLREALRLQETVPHELRRVQIALLDLRIGYVRDPLPNVIRHPSDPSSTQRRILEAVEDLLVVDAPFRVGHLLDELRQAAVLPQSLAQLRVAEMIPHHVQMFQNRRHVPGMAGVVVQFPRLPIDLVASAVNILEKHRQQAQHEIGVSVLIEKHAPHIQQTLQIYARLLLLLHISGSSFCILVRVHYAVQDRS